MFRILLFLLLIIAGVLGFSWMKAGALPNWYDQAVIEGANDPVEGFSKIIQNQGIEAFFSDKLSDLLAGKLILDQDEFNALVLTSIAADENGQALLEVSDVLRAQIREDKLEIGSVINLEKLALKSAQRADKFSEMLGFLSVINDKKVYLAITGQPVARDGALAFTDDIAFKIGNLTISKPLISALALPVDRLDRRMLKISYLTINDVSLQGNHIGLAVRPSF